MTNKNEEILGVIRKIRNKFASVFDMEGTEKNDRAQWGEIRGVINSDKSSVEMEKEMWKKID